LHKTGAICKLNSLSYNERKQILMVAALRPKRQSDLPLIGLKV